MIELLIGMVVGGILGYLLSWYTTLVHQARIRREFRELQEALDAEFDPEFFAREYND